MLLRKSLLFIPRLNIFDPTLSLRRRLLDLNPILISHLVGDAGKIVHYLETHCLDIGLGICQGSPI